MALRCKNCGEPIRNSDWTPIVSDGTRWWHGNCADAANRRVSTCSLPADVTDAVSGIALAFIQVSPTSGLPDRLMGAMEANDLDEVEHVSALMVVRIVASGKTSLGKLCAERWAAAFIPQEGNRATTTPEAAPET